MGKYFLVKSTCRWLVLSIVIRRQKFNFQSKTFNLGFNKNIWSFSSIFWDRCLFPWCIFQIYFKKARLLFLKKKKSIFKNTKITILSKNVSKSVKQVLVRRVEITVKFTGQCCYRDVNVLWEIHILRKWSMQIVFEKHRGRWFKYIRVHGRQRSGNDVHLGKFHRVFTI